MQHLLKYQNDVPRGEFPDKFLSVVLFAVGLKPRRGGLLLEEVFEAIAGNIHEMRVVSESEWSMRTAKYRDTVTFTFIILLFHFDFNAPLLLLVRQLGNGPVLPLEHVPRPRVPGLGEGALFEHRFSQRRELLGAGAPDGLVEVVPEDGDDPTGPEDAVDLRIDYKVE